MAEKTIVPELGKKSFTCPHCGAMAHQTWFKTYLDSYGNDQAPWMPDDDGIERIKESDLANEAKTNFIEYYEKNWQRGRGERGTNQVVTLLTSWKMSQPRSVIAARSIPFG